MHFSIYKNKRGRSKVPVKLAEKKTIIVCDDIFVVDLTSSFVFVYRFLYSIAFFSYSTEYIRHAHNQQKRSQR